MDRRRFLAQGARFSLLAAGASTFHGCPLPPIDPVGHTATVAAVRGTDLAAMARDAIDALGGMASIVYPGESVFIKPNFGGVGMVRYDPVQAGDSAKPEIVIAVAEECLKAGAREVVIGEAGQVTSWNWRDVRALDDSESMFDAAERLNRTYGSKLRLACLNHDSPGWSRILSTNKHGAVWISDFAYQADRVISIPVIKTHRWTQVTGALKNFVGITSVKQYGLGSNMRFLLHQAGIEQSFLDIAHALKPDLAVMDLSICCEGNGPHVLPGYWGDTVDMRDRLGQWLILAGTDPVAVDATAARVISHDPAAIQHLSSAYCQGLGQIREDKITLLGEHLANLKVPWKEAEPLQSFLQVLIPGYHLLTDAPA